MSNETDRWLNRNTLIGFTEKRAHAWHYRASDQGAEPNHYPGAIPEDDVRRRLFGWHAVPVPMAMNLADVLGVDHPVWNRVPGRVAVIRDDTMDVLGVHSDSYRPHQYDQWLLDNVTNLLGGQLAIGSAGLLRGGAQAWVSVEVPETIKTREGVDYRPNLLAVTSFDGSLASTYKPCVTNVVCDNTMSAALAESGSSVKIKHTKMSEFDGLSASQALNLIDIVQSSFEREVRRLCETTVTDKQWGAFLDAHAPIPQTPGRGQTMAQNQRAKIDTLWVSDDRVSPWRNTAWGVVQAISTHAHHESIVRKGATRVERNMTRAVTGGVDDLDGRTKRVLSRVLATT